MARGTRPSNEKPAIEVWDPLSETIRFSGSKSILWICACWRHSSLPNHPSAGLRTSLVAKTCFLGRVILEQCPNQMSLAPKYPKETCWNVGLLDPWDVFTTETPFPNSWYTTHPAFLPWRRQCCFFNVVFVTWSISSISSGMSWRFFMVSYEKWLARLTLWLWLT